MTEKQKKQIQESCMYVGNHALKVGLSHKEIFNVVVSLAHGIAIGMELDFESEIKDVEKLILTVMLAIYSQEVVTWLETMD